jgi:hypothetical protein
MNFVSSLSLLSVVFLAAIFPVHSQQCLFQRNVENCPALVKNQTVIPQCGVDGCYNYCNGVLQSCCGPDALRCSVQCPASTTNIVITAGCRLSDANGPGPTPTARPTTRRPTTRPPVPTTPRPAPRPTARPVTRPPVPVTPRPTPRITASPVRVTPRPTTRRPIQSPTGPPAPRPSGTPGFRQCPLRQNTENCARLTVKQAVVPGCGADGCYNYCDNEYRTCCPINSAVCRVSCPASTETTAGCRLS